MPFTSSLWAGPAAWRPTAWRPTSTCFLVVVALLGGCASSAGSGPSASSKEPAPSPPAQTSPPAPSTRSGTQDEAKNAYARRHLIQGLTHAQLGEEDAAIRQYEKALQAAPEAPTVLSALSEALAARGDLSTAIYHAEQARRLAAQEPYYYHRLARLYRRAGQPARAAEAYRALLKHFSDGFRGEAEARRALARLYAEQGRPRKALAAYEALPRQAQQSASPALLTEMLPLYRKAGNTTGVERTLKALVRRGPQGGGHRRALARFYREQGRPQAAAALDARPTAEASPAKASAAKASAAKASATKAPQNATAAQLVKRARSLRREADGPVPKAIRLLKRALAQDSAHAEALALLGEIRFEAGAFPEAADLLTRSLDENPRAPERWARAAEARLRAEQPERAAATAAEGLLLFPGQVPLLRIRATALMRTGRDAEAARRFEEALRVMKADGLLQDADGAAQAARFHEALARLYARQGNADRAARHRKQARALRERPSTAAN